MLKLMLKLVLKLILIILGGVLIGYTIGSAVNEAMIAIDKTPVKSNSDSPVIIWNDDPESIPMDGELVRLEFTKNDTLYIGSAE